MLIDVHAHIGRIGSNMLKPTDYFSPIDLLAKMDEWGIDKSCVLPLNDCPEGPYLDCRTEDILAACHRFPERLIPFCLVDPRFDTNSERTDFRPLLNEYRSRGCVGIGEMIANLHFDDPRLMSLYCHAGEVGFPMLFDMMPHIGDHYGVVDEAGLPRLARALEACPDTVFIGHGPAFWADIDPDTSTDDRRIYGTGPIRADGAVARLMEAHSNLWADLSAGSGYTAMSRDHEYGLAFLDRFQDRLLFGTDYVKCQRDGNYAPMVAFFKQIRDRGEISAQAADKIASSNAVRLLGI